MMWGGGRTVCTLGLKEGGAVLGLWCMEMSMF